MDPGWIAAITAAAVALAAAASWAARWAWRILIRTRDFLDDWAGHPPRPGVEARPGVMERLQSVEKITTEIRAETKPNGGDSMRDDLQAMAAGLAEHRRVTAPAIRDLREDVAHVKDDVAALRSRTELFEHERHDREDPA